MTGVIARKMVLMLILFLLSAPVIANAQAAKKNEVALRRLVSQYYAAYARKDLAATMLFWDKKAAGYAQRRQMTANNFKSYTRIRLEKLRVRRIESHDKTKSVFVSVRLNMQDKEVQEPQESTLFEDVLIFSRQSVSWKIVSQDQVTDILVYKMLAAKSSAERRKVLHSEQEILPQQWQYMRLLLMSFYVTRHDKQKNDLDEIAFVNMIQMEAAEESDSPPFLIVCLLERARTRMENAEYTGAAADLHRALFVSRKNNQVLLEAAALDELGTLQTNLQQYDAAMKNILAAQALGQKAKLPDILALTMAHIATLYHNQGEIRKARETYQAALTLAQKARMYDLEAEDDFNLGQTAEELGNYADALDALDTCLKMVEDSPNVVTCSEALRLKGDILREMGQPQEAKKNYDRALEIATLAPLPDTIASTQISIALLDLQAKRYQEAMKNLQGAIPVMRRYHQSHAVATALNLLGLAYQGLGKTDAASQTFADCIAMSHAGHYQETEAGAISNLGTLLMSQQRYPEALAHFQNALQLAEASDSLDFAFQSLLNIGIIYQDQQQWQPAIDAYRKGIGYVEKLRTRTREQTAQTGIFQKYTEAFFLLSQCLIATKNLPDAFAASEQAKARSLVEIMQNGRINLRKAMTKDEQKRERELDAALTAAQSALDRKRAQPNSSQDTLQDLMQRQNDLRGEQESFRRQLFLAHPELQTQRAQFKPTDAAELQTAIFANAPDMTLISYSVGAEETTLYVFTPGDKAAELHIYSVPIKAEALTAQVQAFWQQCATADGKFPQRGVVTPQNNAPAPADYRDGAKALYQLLLAPAAKELAGKKRLVVSPDGVLNTLPFQALMDADGKHLIENFAVSYAPSLTALTKMTALADRKHAAQTSGAVTTELFALGRPQFTEDAEHLSDLPGTEPEVTRIAAIFGGKALLGADATKPRVLAGIGTARYIHLATHGLLNEANPMYSAIALTKSPTDDGRLYAQELTEMDLRADLVTLSACQTALGQQVSGEGVLGLTWALFVAGTPSSVVSQWSVSDSTTSALMIAFYEALHNTTTKSDKAVSLQKAQIQLMHDGLHSHPYYWAPFVLVGDWRKNE